MTEPRHRPFTGAFVMDRVIKWLRDSSANELAKVKAENAALREKLEQIRKELYK